jgi:hypothetical protein
MWPSVRWNDPVLQKFLYPSLQGVKIFHSLLMLLRVQVNLLQHNTAWQQNPRDCSSVHCFNVDKFCKTVCRKMVYAIQIAHWEIKEVRTLATANVVVSHKHTQELFNSFAPELNVLDQCKMQESKRLPLLHWWQLFPTCHFKPHTALSTVASVQSKSVKEYLASTTALQIAVWLNRLKS